MAPSEQALLLENPERKVHLVNRNSFTSVTQFRGAEEEIRTHNYQAVRLGNLWVRDVWLIVGIGSRLRRIRRLGRRAIKASENEIRV